MEHMSQSGDHKIYVYKQTDSGGLDCILGQTSTSNKPKTGIEWNVLVGQSHVGYCKPENISYPFNLAN